MRLAIALLACLPALPAHADALTFVGKLGARDIVVELTQPSDGAVAGRYTFMDTGGDIPLVPVSHAKNRWVLHEEAPCGEDDCILDDMGKVLEAPIAAAWELTYDPQTYIATGTREAEGSKTKRQGLELMALAWRTLGESEEATAFGLHDRSAIFSYDDDFVLDWSTAPYEMSLLEIPLEEGPEQRIGDARFHYVTDPRTKFAFPRAIAFDDGSPVEAVNAILAGRHFRMSLAALDCLALVYASYGMDSDWGIRGGHLGDYDNEHVVLTYLSPRLVSWSQSGSLYCTGAHPYNHYDSYTYDVASGEPIDLGAIFSDWVPRQWGTAPGEIADIGLASENPDAYHWGPGPGLIAYIRDNLPAELLDPEFDEACYGDQALADHLDIRFGEGPSAIFTGSGYAHVNAFCNDDLFTAPLADLRQFLTPAAKDYFPELGD